MAIPLPRVMRLETFPYSSLERIGDQDVVEHRGDILPLVKISNLLQERRGRSRSLRRERRTDEKFQAIICLKDGRHVGLVVDDILDTIEQNPADLRPPSRMGVLANAMIGGRVTEILDLDALCTSSAFAPISAQKLVEAKV
jgi:two-component system, chemotaxis family, sensor kinase CheA